VTEKLLAYSVGRGIEYYDLPAVRQIARESAPADYRWSSLILGIVRSRPFSMGLVKENNREAQARAERERDSAKR
jgi:hypothetical protein